MRRAAFVDRDGTLDELVPDPVSGEPEGPLHARDVTLIPGAAAALGDLTGAGWLLIGVTNQPAAAKAKVSVDELAEVQARVLELLPAEGVRFDDFRLCMHHPDGVVPALSRECDCRKPAPGMLLEAAGPLGVDLSASWMIGDTDSDVEAGQGGRLQDRADRTPAKRPQAQRVCRSGRHGARPGQCREVASVGGAGKLTRVIHDLDVKIFADGADLDGILALAADRRIAGFTTNPTLMWKAGLTDYEEFAKRLLERIDKHPISFEVFADDASEMRRQALKISSWGDNVYVKIPVSTTGGEPMAPLVRELSERGVKVNVTALFTTAQVELITAALKDGAPSYISVFAGRIADAGVDPVPLMARAVDIMVDAPRSELIWASPREILNVIQADQVGCHIITVTHDLLKKLDLLGKDLEQFSLETVQMFYRDAVAAGFSL